MRKSLIAIIVVACTLVFLYVYRVEQRIARGREAFARYSCGSCHLYRAAPSLQNVGKKYDRRTLTQFLRDPESVYRARGNRPLNEGFTPMPRMNVSGDDIPALVAYLQDLSD